MSREPSAGRDRHVTDEGGPMHGLAPVVTVELAASGAGPGVVLPMLTAADIPFRGE